MFALGKLKEMAKSQMKDNLITDQDQEKIVFEESTIHRKEDHLTISQKELTVKFINSIIETQNKISYNAMKRNKCI